MMVIVVVMIMMVVVMTSGGSCDDVDDDHDGDDETSRLTSTPVFQVTHNSTTRCTLHVHHYIHTTYLYIAPGSVNPVNLK